MAHKTFISYKYADDDVRSLCGKPSTVRNYVTYYQNSHEADIINKGECDNEDLSNLSDNTIWEKLKDRMYDSTVTVLFISPNMKDKYKKERDQWIPWEIAYSVREKTRSGRTSHRNAIVAVILPDRDGNYAYYYSMRHFGIVEENIGNGYIELVKWDDFLRAEDKFIEKAEYMRDTIKDFRIRTKI